MLKMKYVKANGTATTATSPVGPVNLLLFSLFSSIKIFFNDYLVSPVDQNAGYVHWLHYLTQNDSKKESIGSLAMYYDDSMDTESKCNQSNPYSATNINEGLKVRSQFFAESKEVRMIGEIATAPMQSPQLLLPGKWNQFLFCGRGFC